MKLNPDFDLWYEQLPPFSEQKLRAWNTLTSAQQQSWNERTVFHEFAKVAPLGIDPSTIESCIRPKADIRCVISGESHYFELAEVTDEVLARRIAIAAKQRRNTFSGPFLQMEPLCRIYQRKCGKTYDTNGHDLHLLLYYSTDHQVPYIEGLRTDISKRRGEIRERLCDSPFRTAWLFDGWDHVLIDQIER